MIRHFPEDFIFGASIASDQIEGAIYADGRGPSLWDRFSETPSKGNKNHSKTIDADHYKRNSEAMNHIKQLNAQAYQLSVAWPILFPESESKVNQAGLAFYDKILDQLLHNNITPWICLDPWNLPQSLQDLGGWCNRDIQYWFRDYALTVCKHFGDRVNSLCLGQGEGVHVPGLTDLTSLLKVTHHQNLAQGLGIQSIRQAMPALSLGGVFNMTPDRATQQEAMQDFIQPDDLKIIHQPLDFIVLNHYSCSRSTPNKTLATETKQLEPQNRPLTNMGRSIEADALYHLLMLIKTHSNNPPVFVTDKGGAFADQRHINGQVQENDRVELFKGQLNALLDAIEDGANVKGYFHWSLVDEKQLESAQLSSKTQTPRHQESFDFLARTMKSRSLEDDRQAQQKNSAPQAPFNKINQLIGLTNGYYTKGWTPATSSNFSIFENNIVWVTRSGLHKGFLKVEDFIPLTPSGQPLYSNQVGSNQAQHKPSAETDLHLIIYNHIPTANVVLHTHSPYTTALSMATNSDSIPLENYELFKAFQGIETHDIQLHLPVYSNSQDIPALAEQVSRDIIDFHEKQQIPAFIIRGHGIYTWGRTVEEADRHLEAIEFLLHCEYLRRSLKP